MQIAIASSNTLAQALTTVESWVDSYSVGDQCYCQSNFDHGIEDVPISTAAGERTVRKVCAAIGSGPGPDGYPIYDDVQCGNDPINDYSDETACPGRVDLGKASFSITGLSFCQVPATAVFASAGPGAIAMPGSGISNWRPRVLRSLPCRRPHRESSSMPWSSAALAT